MKLLQTYYTSCKKGQLGGAGFQFYSYSDGLSADELKEISIIGNYFPPLHLPTQPSEEEVENLFPLAFSYFKLRSGRVGVCQSKYIGQDYSGRYGNFFSHCLILEAGSFPFYPINLFKHPVFRQKLTVLEENESEKPASLPTLSIEDLEPIMDTGPEECGDFLSTSRESAFKGVIDALLVQRTSNRRIVLADEPEYAYLWLKIITSSFPVELIKDITYTTYSFDPANSNFDLCYTLNKGGRFVFDNQMLRDFQFFVYNVQDQNYSKSVIESSYAKMLLIAFGISTQKLKQFHQFLHYFKYPSLNKDIDDALGLFNLIQGGMNLQKVNFLDIQRYFKFVHQYDMGEHVVKILDFLTKQSTAHFLIEKFESFEQAAIVIETLFVAAVKSPETKQKQYSCDFYFNSLIALIIRQGLSKDDQAVNDFINFNLKITNLEFAKSNFFITDITSNDRLKTIAELLDNGVDEKIRNASSFYFSLFFSAIQVTYEQEHRPLNNMSNFIKNQVFKHVDDYDCLFKLFGLFVQKPRLFYEYFAEIRSHVSSQSNALEQLHKVFITIYNQQEFDSKKIIIKELSKNEEIELIFTLANSEIQLITNKAAAYHSYLTRNEQFFKRYADRSVEFMLEYARVLELKYPKDEVKTYLGYANQISDGRFHHQLITLLEAEINLDNPEKVDSDIIQGIHYARQKASPMPDENGLEHLYFGQQLEQKNLELAGFIKKIPSIGILKSKNTEPVLKWLLYLIFAAIDKKGEFRYFTVFATTNISPQYLKFALDELFLYGYHHDIELLSWFIAYLTIEEKKSKELAIEYQGTLQEIKVILPEVLLEQKESFLNKLEKHLLEHEASSEKYWRAICEACEKLRQERPKGLMNSFKSLWGRK